MTRRSLWIDLVISTALYVIAAIIDSPELRFFAVMALFTGNVVFALRVRDDRSLFLFFHLGILLFILGRPCLAVLMGKDWMALGDATATVFVLDLMAVSLVGLRLGAGALGLRREHRDPKVVKSAKDRSYARAVPGDAEVPSSRDRIGRARHRLLEILVGRDTRENVRLAAMLIFIIGIIGTLVIEYQKITIMGGHLVIDYYTIDSDSYTSPLWRILAASEPYALCAVLATMPRRRTSAICLGIHVLLAALPLVYGIRGSFSLACVFAVLYLVIRQGLDGHGWITKKVAIAALIAIPVGLIGLGMLDYLRFHWLPDNMGPFDYLIDALYRQGVTFEVMGKAFVHGDEISALGFKFYSLGPIISNFTQGFIGQNVFGFQDLGSANSVALALQGNSYEHALSYFAEPGYLDGLGLGTSYLLELNADFGYVGVFVFSFAFGALMTAAPRWISRNWFVGMLVLCGCLSLFFVPRSNAVQCIKFLFTIQFWFDAVIIIGCAMLFDRFRVAQRLFGEREGRFSGDGNPR